jgi:threonine/homoserine/homoserine lactone efflux protein
MNLTPFLAYVFVTTFTPGPNNILSMTNAMRDGYRKTLRFLGGITAGFLVVMLVCGLLNFALLSLLPQVRIWLNVLGAAYMVYLAAHIVFSKPAAEGEKPSGMNSFKAGFGLQFLNLKGILYGITVFSTFIVQAYHDPLTVSLFAPLLAAIAFIAISCWALGGGLFRSWLNRYSRYFNLAMGALLVYTAVASLIG